MQWTWVYTKVTEVQVLGEWKYWTHKLASLKNEGYAVMNKYPEAASVVLWVYRVLSDIENLARCTPTKVGGKLWVDLHCESREGEQSTFVRF
jgi:hypothetical protein